MFGLVYNSLAVNKIAIELPASKSISNRALILNAFYQNSILLHNLSLADDTQLMNWALTTKQTTINLKNAGTCMRFLTAYFATQHNRKMWLLCSERMKQRPIANLVGTLQNLGAEINYLEQENFPPLFIKGKLMEGKKIAINATESSQYITALMLIAPFIKNGLSIELLGNIASFDYIKMTTLVMEMFDLEVFVKNNVISIKQQPKTIPIKEFTIENDWSSAAFWYLTCCLNNQLSITLNNLSLNSVQGDKVTAKIFEQLGVITTQNNTNLVIQKVAEANAVCNFDLSNCIDLAPALCVACAALNITATVTGLENLVIKESNRLNAIVTELKKLGYHVFNNNNTIFIQKSSGINFEKPNTINTYSDHRIAMAFAPMALKFKYLNIDNPAVVDKSYPHFFTELAKIGICIKPLL